MRRSPARRPLAPAIAVSGALILAACGGETPNAVTPGSQAFAGPEAATVTIERSRYDPTELTVAAGTEVQFVNLDGFDHTVTASDSSTLDFDSSSLGQDETFTQTFDRSGAYDYFCEIHPTMRATVIVE